MDKREKDLKMRACKFFETFESIRTPWCPGVPGVPGGGGAQGRLGVPAHCPGADEDRDRCLEPTQVRAECSTRLTAGLSRQKCENNKHITSLNLLISGLSVMG